MTGNVVDIAQARASRTSEEGRGTSEGQSTSDGHRSENQSITSSYFRAVKVLPSSRKKRQSPAAKRPSVDKLTFRVPAYTDAQIMRFERSSVSIAADNSRKIPTGQAVFIGKFRLAENSDLSDNSAMSTVDEVRNRVQRAFEGSGESPITLALKWDLERNHIREFLTGKKDSLKYEVIENLADHFGIPIDLLIIRRPKKRRKVA